MKLKAAVIQTNAGPVVEDNLRACEALIRAAAKQGATFICTPENTCRMRSTPEGRLETSWEQQDHPAIPFFSKLAKDLGVTINAGSLSSIRAGKDKLVNRSFLFRKDGSIAATYDKIHMFDVDLPNGDKYRESDTIVPGDAMTVAEVDGVKLGMTICYDLRFAYLYRALAKKGVDMISIPSAFTVPTGQAHWEVLMRARAIETGAFIIAAAQVGTHEGGRATYGHSLIVAPWGQIIAEVQGDKPGFAVVELDLDEVAKARTAVPSLQHDRVFKN